MPRTPGMALSWVAISAAIATPSWAAEGPGLLHTGQGLHAGDDRHLPVQPCRADRVHPPGETGQVEDRLRQQKVGARSDLLPQAEQVQLGGLLIGVGGRPDEHFGQRAAVDHLPEGLGELNGIEVVDAGGLWTGAQRLVVAGQAEDGVDAQGRRAVRVAFEGDAIAIPRHHGQNAGAAFRRQHRCAGQCRAAGRAGVIRHHHRVQVGGQQGGELLHRGGIAALWRQALGREGQPAGGQCLAKFTVLCRHG